MGILSRGKEHQQNEAQPKQQSETLASQPEQQAEKQNGLGQSVKHAVKDTADEALRFVIVGVLNTLLGAALTFGFYNLADWGYFLSSVLSYLLASIFSFFMNKKFTFRNNDSLSRSAARFAVNVAVCYTLAFGLAKPAVLAAMAHKGFSQKVTDNLALLTGMVLFTVFNFFGQKFFAFRKK